MPSGTSAAGGSTNAAPINTDALPPTAVQIMSFHGILAAGSGVIAVCATSAAAANDDSGAGPESVDARRSRSYDIRRPESPKTRYASLIAAISADDDGDRSG